MIGICSIARPRPAVVRACPNEARDERRTSAILHDSPHQAPNGSGCEIGGVPDELVEDVEVAVERLFLAAHAQELLRALGVDMDVVAIDEHLSLGGGIEAGDALDGGRLAGAVWSQEAETLPGRNIERDVRHRVDEAAGPQPIALAQMDNTQGHERARFHPGFTTQSERMRC